jgi:hypothetical protein
MKTNRVIPTTILVLFCTLAAFLPSNVQAQTNADINLASAAFEVTVPVNINHFAFTPVSIPSGKRLVVQNVNISGAAATTGGYVQPIVILSSTINSAAANIHYYAPPRSVTDPTQFYEDQQTTIYADTLEVGPAFAGYTPTFLVFNVVITGYLVDLSGPPS